MYAGSTLKIKKIWQQNMSQGLTMALPLLQIKPNFVRGGVSTLSEKTCSGWQNTRCKPWLIYATMESPFSTVIPLLCYSTGLHVKTVYTSLGTSCHNAYTKLFCWLLMHICILSNCNFQAKCIPAWAEYNRISIEEVPKLVYAFWMCKPITQITSWSTGSAGLSTYSPLIRHTDKSDWK